MENSIHPTAIIFPNVNIGKNVHIGPYCIIGAPAEMKNDFFGEPKGVNIGDGTIITGAATIDSGYKEATNIGSRCFIMKGAHIGHDCQIEDDATISARAVLAGHVRVCRHSNIGINSSLHQFSLIGAGSMVGMGSVVTKKSACPPFSKLAGSPAKSIGENSHVKSRLSSEEIDSLEKEYEKIKSMYLNAQA